MVAVESAPGGEIQQLVLRPHGALSWHGAVVLWAVTAVYCLTIAAGMALLGAWPVLPFAGLELLALGAALYVTVSHNERQEVVSVQADRVVVEKGYRRPDQRWDLPRHWAQVCLERRGWYSSRLTVRAPGQAVQVGAFLTDDERDELAEALGAVLGLGCQVERAGV